MKKWYKITAREDSAEVSIFGDIGSSWWGDSVTLANFKAEFDKIRDKTKQDPLAVFHQALDNVSVRFSADSITGEYIPGLHGSVIGPSAETFQDHPGASLCRAYEHDGKCSGCRACWDKSIELICYPAHGRKMAKVIMMKAAV
jgi:hypothetical protein